MSDFKGIPFPQGLFCFMDIPFEGYYYRGVVPPAQSAVPISRTRECRTTLNPAHNTNKGKEEREKERQKGERLKGDFFHMSPPSHLRLWYWLQVGRQCWEIWHHCWCHPCQHCWHHIINFGTNGPVTSVMTSSLTSLVHLPVHRTQFNGDPKKHRNAKTTPMKPTPTPT